MKATMRLAALALLTAGLYAAPTSAAQSRPDGIAPALCNDADTPVAMSERERRDLLVELAHHALQSSRIVGTTGAVPGVTSGNTTLCRRAPPAPHGDAASRFMRVAAAR